jgi:hypothetical protein
MELKAIKKNLGKNRVIVIAYLKWQSLFGEVALDSWINMPFVNCFLPSRVMEARRTIWTTLILSLVLSFNADANRPSGKVSSSFSVSPVRDHPAGFLEILPIPFHRVIGQSTGASSDQLLKDQKRHKKTRISEAFIHVYWTVQVFAQRSRPDSIPGSPDLTPVRAIGFFLRGPPSTPC